MRILITNNTLNGRAGSELYVRDLALALRRRGHTPVAYSPDLGEVAHEIRTSGITVVDDLDQLTVPPDIIHGQHHLETMTALLRFPRVPAVYFCHGWLPWEEAPPSFPRLLRYVVIDHPCRDRVQLEHGIPENKITLIRNFVDLERFQPRHAPLPERPRRALLFSNYSHQFLSGAVIREACKSHGIDLDVVGVGSGNSSAEPEKMLADYDLIFARGRSALEALAVGAAVIITGIRSIGPMVTSEEMETLRDLNFGLRAFREPMTQEAVGNEIARYNAADAAEVSARIRGSVSLERTLDEILSLYDEVVLENKDLKTDASEEAAASSAYLAWVAPTYMAALASAAESDQELAQQRDDLVEKQQELEAISNSFGWKLISRYGPIKYSFVQPAVRHVMNLVRRRNGPQP